ncbi:zinc ribbon domain-containing protein [Mycobacterium sp. CVI_P3]|uniref:Zinc ribbon domain-containing protein n=1 Tax=Mycobacterium pinniadriaticum TaxID=2994102 RepID=A0ABT3S9Y7_9MYCO|nr:zinc ribbon domain-containing protein [Mycobacterium pinniadriaticum]MCX2930021.1 zinc ribbon domain-containing protein [Mycobacterium pinniadriaticum]MCX2936330.1 zinc ribbon domain-containing protein [Mycobacterium pinniadriaticum]
MTIELAPGVPGELVATVEAHGKAVAAADNATVLADFLPDRIGQLIASADVPNRLTGCEVRSIAGVGDDRYDAVIRYLKPDGDWFELRSRWVHFDDGTWRVFSVRNIPETPPWMDLAGPSDDGIDTPHWDGLRAGRLLLQQCAGCANWIWAPRPICPRCHSFDMRWQQVEPVGVIYSWTRTWQPFSREATGHLPYVVVLVELPAAGGCRVVGVLAHADGVTPAIGATVVGHIDSPPDDEHWPLIRWQLEEVQR